MRNGTVEIETFLSYLSYLALKRKVAPSTQNQALAALQYLYQEVLQIPLDEEILPAPAKRTKRLPVMLSKEEALEVIDRLTGVHKLITQLIYGSGLRFT